MRKSLKKLLVVVAAAPLLMAAFCDPVEEGPELFYNTTKVTVSSTSNFSVNDTLWVMGNVSSMIYDGDLQDSIMNSEETIQDVISVLRLKSSDGNSNTIEALEQFELVAKIGEIDFLEVCPKSDLIARAPLNEDGASYSYQIGLIAKSTGDYALSWLEPITLKNQGINTQILAQYPIQGNTKQLGVTRCGSTSIVLDVEDRRSEYFFTVN